MILYFTGTGNSEYVAKRIGDGIGEETYNLFEKIRDNDFSELHSERPWIIVSPTYAWRIPRILERWLERAELSGSREIYFVMTCGDSIGNAGKYLKALCLKLQMNYNGCFRVIMPENYIAMFTTPTKDEALSIIEKAEAEIDEAIELIKSGRSFSEPELSLTDSLYSGIVNELFYPLFVHSKKFYVTESCISCGLCEAVCPLSNVRIIGGKPSWSDNCTHCMACICRCPKEAIEYGRRSKGLPRYTFPK